MTYLPFHVPWSARLLGHQVITSGTLMLRNLLLNPAIWDILRKETNLLCRMYLKKLIKAMCIIFFPCHFKIQNKKSHTTACLVHVPLILRRFQFPCFLYSALPKIHQWLWHSKTYWVHPVYHKTLHQVKWFKEQEYRCPFYSIYLYDYQHKNKM